MKDLLDIRGASGTSYRFRHVPADQSLPAMSGNFVFVSCPAGEPIIVGSGTADALVQARAAWPDAVTTHKVEALYVRLNLARQVRIREHDDIAAEHQPLIILAETGAVVAPATGDGNGG